jgi:hypothetical protein
MKAHYMPRRNSRLPRELKIEKAVYLGRRQDKDVPVFSMKHGVDKFGAGRERDKQKGN